MSRGERSFFQEDMAVHGLPFICSFPNHGPSYQRMDHDLRVYLSLQPSLLLILFGQGSNIVNHLPHLIIRHAWKGHHARSLGTLFDDPIHLPI